LHEAGPEAPTQPAPAGEATAEMSNGIAPPAEAAPAAASSEPAMIEIWRPGRPRDEQRPRHKQGRERRRPQAPEAPAADAAKAGEAPAQETRREQTPRHPAPKRDRAERERRTARPRHDRDQRPPRERNRERPIDPNSPFAALLELKARLEAGQKNES
jgi:ATP-dependent RNA helicase SUPV3L1/SUV3